MKKEKYLSSSIFLTLDKLIKLALNIVTFSVIAKFLSADIFGSYSYNLLIYTVLGVIISFGLDEISSKEIIKAYQEKKDDFFTILSISIKFFFALPLSIILICQYSNEIFFYSLALLVLPFTSFKYHVEANGGGKAFIMPNTLLMIFFSFSKILVIFQDNPVRYLGYILLLESIAGLLLNCLFVNFSSIKIKYNHTLAKKIMKLSLPLWTSAIIAIFANKIDQFYIEYFYGMTEYAGYSFSSRLIEISYTLPNIAMASMMGYLMTSKVSSKNVFQFFYTLTILTTFFSIIALFFVFMFFDKYEKYLSVALILSLALPFNALRVCSGKFYILKDLTYLSLLRSIQGLIIISILIFVLGWLFGITGVAIAFLLTSIYTGIVVDLWHPETREMAKEKIDVLKSSFSLAAYVLLLQQFKSFLVKKV